MAIAGFVAVPGAPVATAQVALSPGQPITKVDRLDLSTNATCAALGSGQVTCVGSGNIPDGTNGSSARAFTSGATDAAGVGHGQGAACVRKGSGVLTCWGGWIRPFTTSPYTPVASLANVISVDGSSQHVCGVQTSGQVACVGAGSYGERGDGLSGPPANRDGTFTVASGINTARQVSTAEAFSCVLLAAGSVSCFGSNFYGNYLSIPASSAAADSFYSTAQPIPGLTSVNSISLAYYQGCALITDGTVKCFGGRSSATATSGRNGGAAGIAPTQVAGISTARAVSVGLDHGCALLADTTVSCWGNNVASQLGRSTGTGWQPAAVVPGLSNAISIHAGGNGTCAVISDGTVRCWGANGNGQLGLNGTTIFTPTVVPGLSFGGKFTPTAPQRILDTRNGTRPGAGSVTSLPIRGVAGIPLPSTANGVLLNVTVVGASGDGWVTVYPCSATPPNSSNLNYTVGQIIPNLVAAPLSVDGRVCLYTAASTDLVVDLEGYYDNATGSNYTGVSPTRLLDTRFGTGAPIGKIAVNGVIQLQIAGTNGVPAGASGIVMNVTVTQPDGDGWITAYPCSASPPTASNLNYTTGLTIPNLVSVPLSPSGTVCLYSRQPTHLVADLAGYYGPSGPAFAPVDPYRLLDTRFGVGAPTGKLTAGSILRLKVRNTPGGAPADAQTVVLNVTVVDPSGDGYATVYPCTAAPPNASNLNFNAGRNIPNLVMSPISASDEICIFATANAHFIADINGHYRPL
jgi:Regulator of chromosome condensation (RCC1) repeat